MSETREPSPSRDPSPESDQEESLLALQIQAFLEASEEIDIDQETVEDLMRVLSETQNGAKSEQLDIKDEVVAADDQRNDSPQLAETNQTEGK
jgi:NAD-dependent histone deacetylase SIR2